MSFLQGLGTSDPRDYYEGLDLASKHHAAMRRKQRRQADEYLDRQDVAPKIAPTPMGHPPLPTAPAPLPTRRTDNPHPDVHTPDPSTAYPKTGLTPPVPVRGLTTQTNVVPPGGGNPNFTAPNPNPNAPNPHFGAPNPNAPPSAESVVSARLVKGRVIEPALRAINRLIGAPPGSRVNPNQTHPPLSPRVRQVTEWVQSDDAVQYFTENPDEAGQFLANPVEYYGAFLANRSVVQNFVPMTTSTPNPDYKETPKNKVWQAASFKRLSSKIKNPQSPALNTRMASEVMRVAKEVGVDPVLAMTIFGLETDYGQNIKTSSGDAVGPMQVVPSNLKIYKEWFNKNSHKVPAHLVDMANSLKSAHDHSDNIKLSMLMLWVEENDLYIQRNLIPAYYNANAWKGKGKTSSLPNAESHNYSVVAPQLYNHLGPIMAQSGVAAPAAQQQSWRSQVPQQQQPAQSGLLINNKGHRITTAAEVQGARVAAGLPTEKPSFSQKAAASIDKDQMVAADTNHLLRDPLGLQFETEGLIREWERHHLLQQMGGGDWRRRRKRQIEASLRYMSGVQSIDDLAHGNTGRASQVLSHYAKADVSVHPRSDGNFDVMKNGNVWQYDVTPQRMSQLLRSRVDAGFLAEQRAAKVAAVEAAKFDREKVTEAYHAVGLQHVKDIGARQIELMKQRGFKILNQEDRTFTKDGKVYTVGIGLETKVDGKTVKYNQIDAVPFQFEPAQ